MTHIGVLGGTFDPVHTGHLLLAEQALFRAGLSKVIFMPTHIQPFKQDADVTNDDDRLRMLRLAVSGNPNFEITTVETDREGVSYTIDSLRMLRSQIEAEYLGREVPKISFILGTDMFLMVEKWHEAEALLSEFGFIVGIRAGYRHEEAIRLAEKLREKYDAVIETIDNPPLELSSSEIREKVKAGETVRYLLPEDVRRYLLVMEKETARRFAHTKRVIDLSVEMAHRFGEDTRKAFTAALLHDYEKSEAGGVENNLTHGELAAKAAAEEFGIEDPDVLDAIRYHTTGRAGMSRLELIVFLADTVEPGRDYADIVRLRESCLDNLETGALTVLRELKLYLEKKGFEVSHYTTDAIDDLCHRCMTKAGDFEQE